jgi:hypothetical protein
VGDRYTIYGVGEAATPSVGKSNAPGLFVGSGSGVMEGVMVAGGASAVWVSKKFAITVPTPAVSDALISGVGASVA